MQKKLFLNTYSKYFSSGVYDKRYNGKLSLRELAVTNEFILRHASIIEHAESDMNGGVCVLKVFDYGCGTGRYFDAFKNSAKALQAKNIQIELTGIDPIEEGLNQFTDKLINHYGFKSISPGEQQSRNGTIIEYRTLIHDELKMRVRLLLNDLDSDLNDEASVIGKQTCGICMFGVLSHISHHSRRVSTMNMLCSLSKGSVLFSLPNASTSFLDEQKKYNSRDISYSRDDEIRDIPYHVYTYNEIGEDLFEASAVLELGIRALNIMNQSSTNNNWLLDILDDFASKNMPQCFVEYFCNYFLFEAKKKSLQNERKTDIHSELSISNKSNIF